MGVEAKHEEECQMVRIPERLEALTANFVMRSGIHEDENEKHEMASDTTRLVIMYLNRRLLPNLCII
jgi:hypothetical protein